MNSYQRLRHKNKLLTNEVVALKMALEDKGNVFFKENKWLGFNQCVTAVVVDGAIVELGRSYGITGQCASTNLPKSHKENEAGYEQTNAKD